MSSVTFLITSLLAEVTFVLQKINHFPQKTLALAVASVLLSISVPANAVDRFWACGNGTWNQTCWSSTETGAAVLGQPANGSHAIISNFGLTTNTINYVNTLYPSAVLNSLYINTSDPYGQGLIKFNMTTGGNLSVIDEYLALTMFNQSTGTHNASNLYVYSGIYNLSGTGVLQTVYAHISHTFNQTGGSHTVTGNLDINGGSTSGNQGTYNLSNGILNTAGTTISSAISTVGRFKQSGGEHHVTGVLDVLGGAFYNMNGGGLTTQSTKVSGAFKHNLGTHTITDDLAVRSGSYTLSNSGNIRNGNNTFIPSVLNDNNTLIGGGMGGSFIQSGGTHNVAGVLWLGGDWQIDGAGSYQLSGGTLNTGQTQVGNFGAGQFTQSGGTHNVSSLKIGSQDYTSGSGIYTLSGGLLNASDTIVNANGALTLNGGTLQGNVVQNGSLVLAGGTLQGNISQNGKLSVTKTSTVNGNIALGYKSGNQVDASLNINGVLTVKPSLSSEYAIAGNGALNIGAGGMLLGQGAVGVNVNNAGVLKAKGGNLTLDGNNFSNTGLVINAAGSNLFVTAATVNNAGNITVASGGTIAFDTAIDNATGKQVTLQGGTLAAPHLSNAIGGKVTGFGTIVGSLDNAGTLDFYGSTNIVGDLNNLAGATLLVRNDQTLITGATINNGTIQTLKGTVIFEGGLTNNGAYLSDPSDNYFTDLTITDIGYLVGEIGDRFIMTGDFINHSQQAGIWNTAAASLLFTGLGTQDLYLAGRDFGADQSGYHNNFSWGDLQIGSGANLSLYDGNNDDGGAFYTGLIIGAIFNDGMVDNITGNGYNIYYNAVLAGNAYLGGLTYNLNGGGRLIGLTSVPLPASVWLMLASLLVGLSSQRRRSSAVAREASC